MRLRIMKRLAGLLGDCGCERGAGEFERAADRTKTLSAVDNLTWRCVVIVLGRWLIFVRLKLIGIAPPSGG
jgi:hypothetical protein